MKYDFCQKHNIKIYMYIFFREQRFVLGKFIILNIKHTPYIDNMNLPCKNACCLQAWCS